VVAVVGVGVCRRCRSSLWFLFLLARPSIFRPTVALDKTAFRKQLAIVFVALFCLLSMYFVQFGLHRGLYGVAWWRRAGVSAKLLRGVWRAQRSTS
jgi:phosphotransferase system  glucose/maltose/N-acetylglucosamine-specific IIC component